MKKWIKREKKKFPYFRKKSNIFQQIREREQKIKEKLPKYAIVNNKGKIIEKCRLSGTAKSRLRELQKNYYEELKIEKI